jgi:DNA-binding NarL/FixJ family response regulator
VSGSAGGSVRVVVAYENALGAEALQVALAREPDLDVLAATSSSDAVETAVSGRADVVVIDFAVDDDEGPVAAAAVRSRLPGVGLLMLVEGDRSDQVMLASVAAGCTGVLSKERAIRELVDAIRRVAKGEVLLGADVLARLLPMRAAPRVTTTLSPRELEVLRLLRDGVSTREMAARLRLSHHTVRNHAQAVLAKLRATNRLEAVAIDIRQGVIDR